MIDGTKKDGSAWEHALCIPLQRTKPGDAGDYVEEIVGVMQVKTSSLARALELIWLQVFRGQADLPFTEYEVDMYSALSKFSMSLLNGVPNKTAFWELSCYDHCPSCGWGSKALGPAVCNPSLEKALEAEAAILCKKASSLKEAADKIVCEQLSISHLIFA